MYQVQISKKFIFIVVSHTQTFNLQIRAEKLFQHGKIILKPITHHIKFATIRFIHKALWVGHKSTSKPLFTLFNIRRELFTDVAEWLRLSQNKTELGHILQIAADNSAFLQSNRHFSCFSGHVGIAITVATNP